jgi:hypothetical protein
MTAKKAGFTPEQVALTLQSLRDLKAHLDTLPDVEVMWRISKPLVPELGVDNQLHELAGAELVRLLEWADAVVTTPSTVMLETMLLGRPVAALDYANTPRFVPTAWTISAREHIPRVVAELLDPSTRKMAFQRDCLDDCLECDGPAAPRVATLIERMCAAARSAPGGARALPAALLGGDEGSPRRAAPSLAELYPDQDVFAETDPAALQVRIARLQKDNERLRRELQRRSVAHRLYTLGRTLARRVNTVVGS